MSSVRFNSNVGVKRGSNDARAAMKAITARYRKLMDHVEEVTPQILYDALEPTFEKSQEYCPEDTGAMKASGYLEITQFRGKPTVEIGYGRGGNPPYTVAVHENLEWRHKAPTRAKWLQVALEEDAQEIQDRIVSQLKRITG